MRRVLERLLNLLAFLLTVGRPVTAEEIRVTVAGYDSDSDEAFRRMFERDKDLLRSMGVPLELRPTDEWEVEYGYVIPPDQYELPDPGLTDEERTALWLAAQIVRLGGHPSGPEAIFKLGGTGMIGGGEALAADLGPAAEELGELFRAVTDRRLVRFEYRDASRLLEPYGLIHRRGHWYVVGRERSVDEVRVFRIDRVQSVEVGDEKEAFRRPKGFRAAEALARQPWEAGTDDMMATVRFDEDVAWWVQRQLSAETELSTDRGGLSASLRVGNPDAFVGWVLGFEDAAEILAPPELREMLVQRVESAG